MLSCWCNKNFKHLTTMSKGLTKEEVLNAVAGEFRDDLSFMEELNSLSWSLKVRLKANLKRDGQRVD